MKEMNKQEYKKQLKEKLKRLPKEDFERAIEYFEEYFADAGEENEASAIEDLGSPQEAAEQIICDMALSYSKEPVKDVKSGMNALWVAVLALFAAPIALPLLLAGIVMLLAVVVMIWALLLSFMIVAGAVVITGPVTVIAGFSVLTKSIPVFLTCTGFGLLFMGVGAALTYGMYLLCRSFCGWTLRMFARLIQKGGRKNDK